MSDPQYRMTLDLNVLNHLGINLYSNIPAVLAEAVANAWDADAETVRIDVDTGGQSVVISDDGHGMSVGDMNEKYLRIGRNRREGYDAVTPKHLRPVMGRKGIGKLSLFSIADTIEVQSFRDGSRSGFTMSLPDIKSLIEGKVGGRTYEPVPLPSERIDVRQGTKITLRDLRKRLVNVETHLRRRVARRFSVIGPEHSFAVHINGNEVGVGDRHYYPMLEFVWHYGEYGEQCRNLCRNISEGEERRVETFSGWIGTVRAPSQLKDEGESLNRILVLSRGKLVQEDILESLEEAGIYTKYVIGEVLAESLDQDDREDIATTSRQALIEDDDRFLELKQELLRELSYIREKWTKFRNQGGKKAALENPAIKEWFKGLGRDDKNRAERIFGKINQMTVDRPEDRTVLFKHGALAFETLKARDNLDALDKVTGENIVQFGEVFGSQDELEAAFYHQIVQGRVRVVSALRQMVDENALERVIQEHVFDHLWLLDPSWERATATESMEQRVTTAFRSVDADLTEEQKRGRVDIRYRTTAGKHVIVELKRAGVTTDTASLLGQVDRYRSALRKLLEETGQRHPNIDTVCVVGRSLRDWGNPGGREESEATLEAKSIRVVSYEALIENAHSAYKDFLEESKEAGRIIRLLGRIEDVEL